MPKLRIALFAGAAALLCGGAALAGPPEPRVLAVDLPDGSVAHVTYFGEVAPQVTVAMLPPPEMPDFDFYECYDSFGYFGHYSPCFRHRWRNGREAHGGRHGAKQQVIAMPPANFVGPQGMPPQFVVQGDQPRGSRYHYMLISTAPDGRVCTQRTEWTSRGRDHEPVVTRTDTGEGCAAMAGPPTFVPPEPPRH